MDRASCWCRRTVLVLTFAVVGCQSSPAYENPHQDALDKKTMNVGPLTCTGQGGVGSSDCAIVGGAMLLLNVLGTSPGAAANGGSVQERKMKAASISGQCEILSPSKKPCDGVLLTLSAPGYSRKAWIAGHEFEINGVKGGKIDITAFSDDYNVATQVKGVRVGSTIQIQLILPPK